jgi:hypothetical protein
VVATLILKPADESKLSSCVAALERGPGPLLAQPTATARIAAAPIRLREDNECFISFLGSGGK